MDQPVRARLGHWMQTFTGKAYWPHDPSPDDVDIEDIAHHLSMLVRWTGAIEDFYSVAEHSINVSETLERFGRRDLALQGLMHDAAEAYLGDLNRPVKYMMDNYRQLEEDNWTMALAPKFDLPLTLDPLVRQADDAMLRKEHAQLMKPSPIPWSAKLIDQTYSDMMMATPPYVFAWTPGEAKWRFLRRFRELTTGEKH